MQTPNQQSSNRPVRVRGLSDDLFILAMRERLNPRDKLPLPEVRVPVYRLGVFGPWELTVANKPVLPGYFNGLQRCEGQNYVLRNNETKVVWMSLTPMERESHSLHIEQAKGKVVVAGLGMGMYLYNICAKPEVTSIHVLEKEAEIIQAFYQLSGCETWPGFDKVTIHHTDALVPSVPVDGLRGADYFYADIWPLIGDARALNDMQVMCHWLEPKVAGWWTMEFDYISETQAKYPGGLPSVLVKSRQALGKETEQHIRVNRRIPVNMAATYQNYMDLCVAAMRISLGIM